MENEYEKKFYGLIKTCYSQSPCYQPLSPVSKESRIVGLVLRNGSSLGALGNKLVGTALGLGLPFAILSEFPFPL